MTDGIKITGGGFQKVTFDGETTPPQPKRNTP